MKHLVAALLPLLLSAACATTATKPPVTSLQDYIDARLDEAPDPEHLEALEALAGAVASTEGARLTFICTHNSRRSHMSQLWAQAGAWRFGLDDVTTFSGGTEATGFNSRAVAALQRAGWRMELPEGGDNPVWEVRYDEDHPTLECFSKVYDQAPNPTERFLAVMTCSSADEACPLVRGADGRFSVPYVDPKLSDGTPEENDTYDERCADIARDMLWVMRRAAELRG
jgi:arsenate reductase